MSSIGAVSSGMTHAMMTPPSAPSQAGKPPAVTDNDGDNDHTAASPTPSSNGRQLNISA